MPRHFDEDQPGRMNFRRIAQEVRRRSGNRRAPSDIQIVNAIGQNCFRPHWLVPAKFESLAWDGRNAIATEDAELWMTEHLVPCFEALQAEWDDRDAFKRRRKGFQRDRLAHMRRVGYTAFQAEFDTLHEERRTRKDVDAWLLKKFADHRDDIPEPEVAIPPKKARKKTKPAPKPAETFPADAPVVMVIGVDGHRRLKWRPLKVEGVAWITHATLKSNQLVRFIGAPDAKPQQLAVRVSWPAQMGRPDDELMMSLANFQAGWGYQAKLQRRVKR